MSEIAEKAILILAALLIIIYISLHFIPDRVEKYSLDPENFSEVWRFATYPFVHLDAKHLIENIIGLTIIAFIAFELKTTFSDFTSTYLSSGYLSVIPIILIMTFTALGASNAIFGAFGLISQEVKKFKINTFLVVLGLTALIFMTSITSYFSFGIGKEFMFALKQSIAHFAAFVYGIGFYFLLEWLNPIITKRKKYTLRRADR